MRKLSEEHKLKISKANKGKIVSEETRRKISHSNKEKTFPMETFPNYGMRNKKYSKETKEKISISTKGKRNPMYGKTHPNKGIKGMWKWSEESKRRVSGRKRSKIHQENLNKSLKIAMNNPEVIHKIVKKRRENNNYIPWCKGLNKNSDERVKKAGEKCSKTKLSEKWRNIVGKELVKKFSAKIQGINIEDWTHFISKEPYDQKWNNNFKRNIRKRDNQICMLCGIHREKLKRAFCVHHIDYNKKNTIPKNCLSLCIRCHLKTNINRLDWTIFFQSLLSKRYNYDYSKTGEIIVTIQNER